MHLPVEISTSNYFAYNSLCASWYSFMTIVCPNVMNLNTRFLLLGACVFMLFAVASGLAFKSLVNEINLQWGEQFAERQVLFDKHRTLSPLIREIHLARQMATEPAIIPR